MAIVEIINPDTKTKTYKYKELSSTELFDQAALTLDILEEYIKKQNDIKITDLNIDMVLLSEALVRLDKRKDYFIIYHEYTDMNEIKRSALLAYWLIKFKPIHINSNDKLLINKYRKINEAFAVFVIYSAINEEISRSNGSFFNISKSYNRKIMYAFKYWDISKEAMMLIAESLCESMKRRTK